MKKRWMLTAALGMLIIPCKAQQNTNDWATNIHCLIRDWSSKL